MSISIMHDLMKQAAGLSMDEQLRLAAYLIEKARSQDTSTAPIAWRDIRGMAKPSLLGEDAQVWVTRTRHESDERREHKSRGDQ